MQTIQDGKMVNTTMTANSETQSIRVLMRILDYKLVEISANGQADADEIANRAIIDVKLLAPDVPRPSGGFADSLGNSIANDANSNSDDLLGSNLKALDASENNESDKYKGCIKPIKVLVKLRLSVVTFDAWHNLIRIESANVSNVSKIPIFGYKIEADNIKAAARKRLQSQNAILEYDVAFNTNEFIDFNIDPDKVALEVTAGKDGEIADPKLVAYSEDARYAIPGVTGSHGKSRATKDGDDSNGKSLQDLIDKAKDAVHDNKHDSDGVKEVKGYIDGKTKVLNCGTASLKVKSTDPQGDNATSGPGDDSISLTNKLGAVKIGKAYENASKAIQYASEPFDIGYSGWKANIVGKWFASDSTVPVPTWKRNLITYGAPLVAMAGSIAVMKAFQFAIQQTDLQNSLDKAAAKQKEQQKAGAVVKDSTIIGNEGYNDRITGSTAKNDIDKYLRR